MTYRVDEMADLTGFTSDISFRRHTHSMRDNPYIEYNVINRVCAMIYKQWCVVSKCGCDVILSAYGVIYAVGVISYVHRV